MSSTETNRCAVTVPNPDAAWVTITDICEPLDWKAIFGNDHPVEIDLGAGDGGFVANRAKTHPETNFLAVERLLGRARKIVKKAFRQNLPNLRVVRLESSYLMHYMIPVASVSIVHLMFPDPWPKRRHHERRVIQPDFVKSVATALRPGGEFRFTTDHSEYFQAALPVINAETGLKSGPLWDFSTDPHTEFQEEFLAEGRVINRARYLKP
jgi:tRNA (guanine-N7-)-methyltransferase